MDTYHFGAHLLDTYQSAPDAVKLAMVLAVPAPLLLVATLAVVLHHVRHLRRIEYEFADREAVRQADRERWREAIDADIRRRLAERGAPPPLPKPLSETQRRQLLGKLRKDEGEKD